MENHQHDHQMKDHSQMKHQGHEKNTGNDSHAGHREHGGAGHDHHKMMIEDYKRRFYISLVLSVPVLALSPMIQNFFNFSLTFSWGNMALFFLSSIVFFYGGYPFLKGLKEEVMGKKPGMMTLIAVAISVAYFYSSAVVFGLEGKMFFWELVTLIDIMLLGHWIEMKSILGASKSLELLVSMMPSSAHKVQGDDVIEIKIEDLQKNDVILVKPGEKVPADGVIVDGESYVNESMLTGESKPVKKSVHEKIIGGSINGNGVIRVKVEYTGEESYLNKVITLVQEAQKAKSKTQNLANRAAKWLTYIALSVGFLTLAVWLLLGFEFVYALERMVTVMVISCPHALGLAVPLVVANSTALAAQNGLLIRNRTAFENSRKISALLFDKTGTLTVGDFGVSRYKSEKEGLADEDMLSIAASLEQNSEHPIAVGIVNKAKELNLDISQVEDFKAITGKGVEGIINNQTVAVVSPGYLQESKISIPENIFGSEAETIVFVLLNNELGGFIALADEIREESYESVAAFKREGIKVLMATGDNERTAKAVSEKLGLDGYFSEVLPHQKVEVIKSLQEEGEFVAMTGDGINDAPALAQADVGIAVGSGTDVAAETADIILVNSNPKDISKLIMFGKATYRKMIQNLIWATAYNSFAIPLAAGVLYVYGIVMGPAVGAVFMSLSTIIVAINAQLLKRQFKNNE
jgi:P-type Cu2+ transporter